MGMEMLAIDIRAQSGAASHVTVGGGGPKGW
jgi:hypothetical protein